METKSVFSLELRDVISCKWEGPGHFPIANLRWYNLIDVIERVRYGLRGIMADLNCGFNRLSGVTICIVMFLVQPDGRASRLVAKQQNGEVMLEIPFTKLVQLEIGRKQVMVDGQAIMLDTQEDARRLSCLVETANIYLFQRRATHFSVPGFTFWLILVAVKRGYKELLSALYPSLYSRSCTPAHHDHLESLLYRVTASLAQEFLGGEGITGPRCQFHEERIPSAQCLGWLYWAIWIGNAHLVNLLMLEGVTATDNPWHNLSPLHIAVLYGHDDVAHTIVASSSKDAKALTRESCEGNSTLFYAAFYGHAKVASSLLRWGADMENVAWNQTALHVAAAQGHANLVQLLLDKGARQHARDADEMTPLLLACEAKREDVIAMFAENKLDFTFRDKEGMNAWQVAIDPRSGSQRVISQSTFDLIMQSFWAGEKPQTMPLPKQRRAIISLELGSVWAALTVDSRYARFEHPQSLPSHMIDTFGRSVELKADPDRWPVSTIEFRIIYACETLDFSIAYGRLNDEYSPGWTKLTIRGGGKFTSNGVGFQSHKNIATDPNAEEVF